MNQGEMKALLSRSVINLDKPQGPSSHQVSAWVRDMFGVARAGHGGTLDPNVTGVLPVALENATKALDALLYGDKEYVCAMKLHRDVPRDRMISVLREFVGEVYQTPPLRSAVKKELRVRRIYDIQVIEMEGRDVLFMSRCQSGTYIRTLCNDVGEALGSGAHMDDLRRTRTACFVEEDSVSLQEVRDAFEYWKESGDDGPIRTILLPMERLLEHLPKVVLRESAVDSVCHGADLAAPGIDSADRKIRKGDAVAMFSPKGEAVALGRCLVNLEEGVSRKGIVVDTKRVFMEAGTYPRMWKTREKEGPV